MGLVLPIEAVKEATAIDLRAFRIVVRNREFAAAPASAPRELNPDGSSLIAVLDRIVEQNIHELRELSFGRDRRNPVRNLLREMLALLFRDRAEGFGTLPHSRREALPAQLLLNALLNAGQHD